MLALVDGIEPKVLTLKEVLEHYIAHRQIIVRRRTEYELRKAKERAHILEGLKIALDNIDEVIETIRRSQTRETAHANLMKKFRLSDIQTTAILEMRLQTLAGLERKKIEDELKEKRKLIKELEAILASEKKIRGIIREEILELKKNFGDERRTKVIRGGVSDFSEEDLVANEEAIITITRDGYIKRMNPSTYRVQKRGGTGISGGTTREGDVIDHLAGVMTHDNLMFFSSTGKVFQTKAYEIPESSRTSKGSAIVNFLGLAQGEGVTAMIAFNKDDQFKYFFMTTTNGVVKKVKISDFDNVRRSGLIAIGLDKDDRLEWVDATTGGDEVILATAQGQAIRFKERDVRPMGRTAGGVRGIKLQKNDTVVGMDVIPQNQKGNQLLIITETGMGKRSDISSYKIQKRGGSGIKTAKITPKTGTIVYSYVLNKADDDRDIILTSQKGQIIRLAMKTVPTLGRATQGVRIMRPRSGDKVATATIL
jgi:DNA gyrase subunit A